MMKQHKEIFDWMEDPYTRYVQKSAPLPRLFGGLIHNALAGEGEGASVLKEAILPFMVSNFNSNEDRGLLQTGLGVAFNIGSGYSEGKLKRDSEKIVKDNFDSKMSDPQAFLEEINDVITRNKELPEEDRESVIEVEDFYNIYIAAKHNGIDHESALESVLATYKSEYISDMLLEKYGIKKSKSKKGETQKDRASEIPNAEKDIESVDEIIDLIMSQILSGIKKEIQIEEDKNSKN